MLFRTVNWWIPSCNGCERKREPELEVIDGEMRGFARTGEREMTNGRVARRYSGALVAWGKAQGTLNSLVEELERFLARMKSDAVDRAALTEPMFRRIQKERRVGEIGARLGLSGPVIRFLTFMVRHGRMEALPEVIQACRDEMDRDAGILRAQVSSATPLDDPRRQSLEEALARWFGKTVRCSFVVKPELLGGVLVRTGDVVLDGSVKGRLDRLTWRLEKAMGGLG